MRRDEDGGGEEAGEKGGVDHMNDCKICNQAMELADTVINAASGSIDKGGALIAAAYAAVAAWVGGLVLSEAALIKTFFLSLGIFIGAMFSDFFKRHKWLTVFVILGTAALFCYKVLAEIDDDEEF